MFVSLDTWGTRIATASPVGLVLVHDEASRVLHFAANQRQGDTGYTAVTDSQVGAVIVCLVLFIGWYRQHCDEPL